MNEQIKTRWVEALRSKKYKQGTGYLHNRSNEQDYYCCLGVLCELAVADGVIVRKKVAFNDGYGPKGGSWQAFDRQVLPPAVMEWAELDDSCGTLPNCDSLTELNDEGRDFEQIADLIEEQL